MSVITTALDKLAERRRQVEEVTVEIERREPELVALRTLYELQVETIEHEIKAKAVYIPESKAHTLIGRLLQLVWCKPKPKLSDAKVIDLLDAYNNLACPQGYDPVKLEDLQERVDGYWRISKVGK